MSETHKNNQFWLLQAIGWSLFTVMALFSGPLWYGFQSVLGDTVFLVVQAISGMLLTLPLRELYRWTLPMPVRLRITISTPAVMSAAVIWTGLRMVVYRQIMPEGHNLDMTGDFGGWFFISIIVMACWTALYYGISYYERAEDETERAHTAILAVHRAKIREREMAAMAKDAQLRMLRYQINPHFLYNTLNAINAMVGLDESNRAQQMLYRLSSFLRRTLDDAVVERTTVSEEMEVLGMYLDIEKIRFDERLKVETDIQPQTEGALLPGLILQPLVENALKYAIEISEDGGTIRLTAKAENEKLRVEVSDTGPGMATDKNAQARGIGLRNVEERLETTYGDAASVELVNQEEGGLCVVLTLPLQYREQSAELAVAQG